MVSFPQALFPIKQNIFPIEFSLSCINFFPKYSIGCGKMQMEESTGNGLHFYNLYALVAPVAQSFHC